jgi:putative sterol carrier protein
MTMAYSNAEEVYKVFKIVESKILQDKPLFEKFSKLDIIYQQQIPNIDATFTIECKGAMKVTFGETTLKPDLTGINDDDIFNKFWQGKLNLMIATTKGQVKLKGAVTKAFKLVPVLNPVYKLYVAALKEAGREDLVVK